MIAGNGEKKTLRLVAEYADICNVVGPPQVVAGLMETLDHHCADVGRDPATICRTVTSMVIVRSSSEKAEAALSPVFRNNPSPFKPIAGTPDQVVAMLGDLLAAGIDGLILSCPDGDGTPQYVTTLSELVVEARAGAR
jgi:alkanesulfonate monooxygenase SsuD/methylene tetrahydromethanopterin reductase-like flavin-dependent oxidoreductase (luciferase family)